jgi:hypothetical protein
LNQINQKTGAILVVCLLALAACGGGSSIKPTVDTAPIYTQIASTALALQTETVLARPTSTDTPAVSATPKFTNTPLSTANQAGTVTPQPGTPSVTAVILKTPKPTSQASCDNMQYVADVTYPDGYAATPGEYMIKTWTVKNLGPCTWNKNYVLIFGWGGVGTNWKTAGPVNLTKSVAPGETIDISISLEAPKTKGSYNGFFVLQNDKGINFPSSPLTIVITVN